MHRNIPYEALMRAVRLCSNVHDFNMERIRIDLALLLNDYPPDFISKHFHRFFHLNNAMSVWKQLDEQVYQHLHQKLLHRPSRREKQLKTMIEDNKQTPTVLKSKPWDNKLMFTKFMFESGPISNLKPAFTQWWKKWYTYPASLVADVKVINCTNINRTLERLFIHKKPLKKMLTRME